MGQLRERVRLAARTLLPQRDWQPIDAWYDPRYDKAFRKNRTQPDDLEAQRKALAELNLGGAPTFSIIVPLYNTPADFLADMAESVLAQTYPLFELVLVNASPENGDLRELVDSYAARDERVQVVELAENQGITGNTNRGIATATGDFVCFLDHDDWIEPDALFEYALAIMGNPAIDMLYCDEDIVVRAGSDWHYQYPFFKAAFSPEHLLCTNYLIHWLTVRRSIVSGLAPAGREFDGSQDYHLALRVSEVARCVHHVPKVLYHWRMSEQSTAANTADKPYAKRANRLAIQRHLERTMPNASIISSGIVSVHNIWFAPDASEKVSVVVDARAGADAFLEAFEQVNTYPNYEIVLVGGEVESAGNRHQSVVQVDAPRDGGLFAVLDAGAKRATGDIFVFFGADCLYGSPEPLEQTVGMLRRPGVGAMGPRTLFADFTVKSYGVGVTPEAIMPLYRGYDRTDAGYHCATRMFQNASAVSWQGLSIRRALYESIGGFDPSFTGEICAADLCQRVIRAGLRIVVSCTVEVSTGDMPAGRRFDFAHNRPDYSDEDRARFLEKWPDLRSKPDPFLNPSLNQESGYPTMSPAFLGTAGRS